MTKTEAIRRIDDALGFRTTGHSLTSTIVNRLVEAQNELEAGKTLPKFLLQEDQTLALASASHTVAIPTGFIRESDDTLIRYYASGSDKPVFLTRKSFIDAARAYLDSDTVASGPPKIYVIRKATIDFIYDADDDYTLYWDYYKKADSLASSENNAWLGDEVGCWWLIGEAGMKMAADIRDQNAAAIFSAMASKARSTLFSKIVDDELASGPLQMGANL